MWTGPFPAARKCRRSRGRTGGLLDPFLVFVRPVHPSDRLEQGAIPHRLVEVHAIQDGRVKASQQLLGHDENLRLAATLTLHWRKVVMSKSTEQSPWASGPGEILRHGLELLKKDFDRNRRLAMISVDNSVELMMKTYLGLPKRITGLTITRKEYDRFYVNITQQLPLTSIGHAFIRLHPDGKVVPLTDEAKAFERDLEPIHNSVQGEGVVAICRTAT
jgi:hypothetical protein